MSGLNVFRATSTPWHMSTHSWATSNMGSVTTQQPGMVQLTTLAGTSSAVTAVAVMPYSRM